MSEKRKPIFTFLLKKQGKKSNKIEIFEAIEFERYASLKCKIGGKILENAYRIRVNGKWFPYKQSKTYFWKSEIRDLIFKSIRF